MDEPIMKPQNVDVTNAITMKNDQMNHLKLPRVNVPRNQLAPYIAMLRQSDYMLWFSNFSGLRSTVGCVKCIMRCMQTMGLFSVLTDDFDAHTNTY
ncbi:hypothetical protein T4A_13669 [Trichinella pseudospiralis]|nr:hypothetical protein T4A_13669 [Trichinella pseudospiralis]